MSAYAVHVARGELGWEVLLTDSGGEVVFRRPSGSEADARALGSTVQQHLYWLSPEKFREYYRLPDPAPAEG